jgi:penicillin-binding protein 2
VVLDQGLVRRYPHGQLLAHILGYVGPVSEQELANDPDPLLQLPEFRIGKSGVERSYDRVLRGRAGRSRIEVNALGRKIRELYREEGEPGEDIELAIDLELQSWCFDRLAAEKAAAAVVLDVHTGGVLAAVSVPSFDPRPFANGIDARSWRSLLENPLHPLVDKCIRGQYPPGSTFKMITALAALEAGVTGPGYEVYCPGFVELGNTRFHCWKEGGHGTLSLVEAIEQSCDVYFYDLARRVGVDAIAAMAQRFGLGERLGIDLPGEKPGIVPTREWKRQRFGTPWQKGETLVAGIGQGYVLATPLQLAVMTARLCNGGRAVIPWIARRARPEANDPSGAAWPSLGISEASLRPVLRGMLEVVNGRRGTARAARLELEGVRLAGKTGTSQVRRITRAERLVGAHKRRDIPWEERDHALFVCFAPYDEPRYAVAVVVEHGGSGAKAAAPIARDIMMRTLEIDPAGRRLADLRGGVPG